MKKLFSIFFSLLYIFLVSGSTLCFHYCGGRVASVGISYLGDSEGCSCGNMMKNSKCCKNRTIHLDIKGEQKSPSPVLTEISYFKYFECQFLSFSPELLEINRIPIITNYHSPPPKSGNSLLIWNSILRV